MQTFQSAVSVGRQPSEDRKRLGLASRGRKRRAARRPATGAASGTKERARLHIRAASLLQAVAPRRLRSAACKATRRNPLSRINGRLRSSRLSVSARIVARRDNYPDNPRERTCMAAATVASCRTASWRTALGPAKPGTS